MQKRIFKGIEYAAGYVSAEGPVVVTDYQLGTSKDSHLTDVDYDRTVSASSAFQAVILEQLQDLEGFLDDYDDEEEDEASPTEDKRDDPKVNPYE